MLEPAAAEEDASLAVVADPGVPQTAPAARVGIVSTVVRRGVYTLGIAIAVFVAFALWFSGLAHARAQVGLDRRFRAELDRRERADWRPHRAGRARGDRAHPSDRSRRSRGRGKHERRAPKGPGHVVGSSLPGQPGNAVIAGRRTLYGGPFHRLGSLRVGDEVAVTTGQGRATYRVASVAKVRAGDGSIFVDHGDNRLTLFTADSRVGASRRLVVTATLTGDAFAAAPLRRTLDPEGLGLTGERGAFGTLLVWLELLLLVALLAALVLTRWSRITTWVVFAPAIALLTWIVYEHAVRLLPATL